MPELEEGTLNIRVTLAPSSSLDTSLQVAEKLEARLMTFPEVLYVSSRVGRAEIGGDPEPVSNVEIIVGLKPVSDVDQCSRSQGLAGVDGGGNVGSPGPAVLLFAAHRHTRR